MKSILDNLQKITWETKRYDQPLTVNEFKTLVKEGVAAMDLMNLCIKKNMYRPIYEPEKYDKPEDIFKELVWNSNNPNKIEIQGINIKASVDRDKINAFFDNNGILLEEKKKIIEKIILPEHQQQLIDGDYIYWINVSLQSRSIYTFMKSGKLKTWKVMLYKNYEKYAPVIHTEGVCKIKDNRVIIVLEMLALYDNLWASLAIYCHNAKQIVENFGGRITNIKPKDPWWKF